MRGPVILRRYRGFINVQLVNSKIAVEIRKGEQSVMVFGREPTEKSKGCLDSIPKRREISIQSSTFKTRDFNLNQFRVKYRKHFDALSDDIHVHQLVLGDGDPKAFRSTLKISSMFGLCFHSLKWRSKICQKRRFGFSNRSVDARSPT